MEQATCLSEWTSTTFRKNRKRGTESGIQEHSRAYWNSVYDQSWQV